MHIILEYLLIGEHPECSEQIEDDSPPEELEGVQSDILIIGRRLLVIVGQAQSLYDILDEES